MWALIIQLWSSFHAQSRNKYRIHVFICRWRTRSPITGSLITFQCQFKTEVFNFGLFSIAPLRIHPHAGYWHFWIDTILPNPIVVALHWARISEVFWCDRSWLCGIAYRMTDANVQTVYCTCFQVGSEWTSVVDKCCRGHYQPLLLLYANPSDSPISLETAPHSTVMVNSDYCFNQNNSGTSLRHQLEQSRHIYLK